MNFAPCTTVQYSNPCVKSSLSFSRIPRSRQAGWRYPGQRVGAGCFQCCGFLCTLTFGMSVAASENDARQGLGVVSPPAYVHRALTHARRREGDHDSEHSVRKVTVPITPCIDHPCRFPPIIPLVRCTNTFPAALHTGLYLHGFVVT